jgi:hypothetical protein
MQTLASLGVGPVDVAQLGETRGKEDILDTTSEKAAFVDPGERVGRRTSLEL